MSKRKNGCYIFCGYDEEGNYLSSSLCGVLMKFGECLYSDISNFNCKNLLLGHCESTDARNDAALKLILKLRKEYGVNE